MNEEREKKKKKIQSPFCCAVRKKNVNISFLDLKHERKKKVRKGIQYEYLFDDLRACRRVL